MATVIDHALRDAEVLRWCLSGGAWHGCMAAPPVHLNSSLRGGGCGHSLMLGKALNSGGGDGRRGAFYGRRRKRGGESAGIVIGGGGISCGRPSGCLH